MSNTIERAVPQLTGRRGWRRPALAVAVVALLALAPQLAQRDDILNLCFPVFLNISLGQSWNMLAGFAGQTSLGHAAFFGIGALVTRMLWAGGYPFVIALLVVREDEEAAQATGVNALTHKLLAFGISSFFAGLAGGVFAFYQVSYYPEAVFSPIWTFDALLISFVGGLGTIGGPVIGAIFYILVREQLAVTLVNLHQVIFGLLFIIVVLAFPGGLVEAWDRLRKARWFPWRR